MGCVGLLGAILVLVWFVAVPSMTALLSGSGPATGLGAAAWLAVALAGQLVVLVPVARVARDRNPGLWAVAWALAAAAAYAFALGLVAALVPHGDMRGPSLAYSLAQLAVALAVVLGPLAWAYARTRDARLPIGALLAEIGWRAPFESPLLTALGVGALLLLPWLVIGSLGDASIAAGVVLGALATAIGAETLFRGIAWSLFERVFARGATMIVMLTAVFVAFLASGVLPGGNWGALGAVGTGWGIGLLAAELRSRSRSVWPAVAAQFCYAVALPLFVDPRSIAADLIPTNLYHALALAYLFVAAFGIAVLLFLERRLLGSRLAPAVRLVLAGVAALALWLVAGGLYVTLGAPGFHPDGFMIVLREQADLSNLPGEPLAARQEVRRRLLEVAERTQTPVVAELERRGLHYRRYYIINAIRVDSDFQLAGEFAQRPDVAEAYLNPNSRPYPVYQTIAPPAGSTAAGIAPGLLAVKADQAWALGARGQGVVVAGADTGVDWTHPALQPHYRGWDGTRASHDYNWYDAWDNAPAPFDADAHGTHTMGTMVGDDGVHQVGMAPDAQWIACRNMRSGLGNPGAYLACLEFFLAPYPVGGDPFRDGDPARAPDVINNSWGCPTFEGCGPDTLRLGVEHLRAGAVMMVVSAGNDGPACGSLNDPPANYAAVFTVGAVDDKGDAVDFSNRGPIDVGTDRALKPDIAAPGVDVRSTVPGGFGQIGWQGTSMAGPHVAGLVALMWSANPALRGRIDATEALIEQSARPESVDVCPLAGAGGACACGGEPAGAVPNYTFGYGMIDALKAVQAALGAGNRQ
jgi:subtilisin family serine protease